MCVTILCKYENVCVCACTSTFASASAKSSTLLRAFAYVAYVACAAAFPSPLFTLVLLCFRDKAGRDTLCCLFMCVCVCVRARHTMLPVWTVMVLQCNDGYGATV
jgi:hypothetical protein